MGYLDDIIIYNRSEKEHLEHLEEIFIRQKAAGLKLKLEQCCFFKKHIQYLGHLISAEGIQPLPEKLKSIAKMPAPKNPKEVKQFLGLVVYYRKFIPRFADISRVLTLNWATLTKEGLCMWFEAIWNQPLHDTPSPNNDCNSNHNNNPTREHHSICPRNSSNNKKSSASDKNYNHKNQSQQTLPKDQEIIQNNSASDKYSDQYDRSYQSMNQSHTTNRNTQKSPGMRKLNDEYDGSYQSHTSRIHNDIYN